MFDQVKAGIEEEAGDEQRQELPDFIRVLGKNVAMIVRDPEDDLYLEDKFGYWDGNRNRIVLNETNNEFQMRETSLHELLHELEDALSTDLGEEVVSRFARGVFCLLQDNAQYAEWLVRQCVRP